MSKPTIDTKLVYGIIADVLPMEGRDYTIDTSYDAENKPRLSISAMTDIGRDFANHLMQKLDDPMRKAGMYVTAGRVMDKEAETINSIRAKIEKEAQELRDSKIQEANKTIAQKKAALEDARKQRIEADGADAPQRPMERTIANELRAIEVNLAHMRLVAIRTAEVRKQVMDSAKEAALADAKAGRNWAVDMNAPISTLFDRQDVTTKLKSTEELIDRIAATMVDIESMKQQAINAAKQYSIHKDSEEAKN